MKNMNCRNILIMLVFVFLTAAGAFAQSASGTHNASLSTVLNADGSIRPNITGSFDPSGYRLAPGPKGGPRFVAADQSSPAGCGDGWDSTFTINGTDAEVMAVVSDGSGNVYIGGSFSAVNNVTASRVAKWNGTTWSAIGSGLGGGNVLAMAVSGTDVYVGGGFSSAGGVPANKVAKWDGSNWSALGSGLGTGFQIVYSIGVSGNNVYAGGNFTGSGVPNRIAQWNGMSWSDMGTGMDDEVLAIAVGSDGTVYAGGRFATAGGVAASRIAKWDGATASWSPIGSGITGGVHAIAVSGTDVYIGGNLGGVVGNVAKWNGTSWGSLGTGVNGAPWAIVVSGTDVYVGGYFTTAGGSSANRIARWNGTNWNQLGTGVGANILHGVHGIAVLGSTVLAAGSFPTAGTAVAKNIATFSSGTWTPFNGSGVDASVGAVAVSGTDVYVAGSFLFAGTLPVNRIAKWNGSAWSALGSGVTGDNLSVRAIVVSGGYVYVGGLFSSIGGVSANNIARWNGTNWSALGSGVTGLNRNIGVMTAVGEDLYVGGSFNTAGGAPANRIAKWNGTSWSGLPNSSIIPNDVVAIVPAGSDMYVGSASTTLDNPNYFLKFDGTTWTALGAGMGGHSPTSIAVSGTDVYVSGAFPSIGGLTVNRIAKWNGSSWSALGSGLPGNSNEVRVAMSGSDLIAVGDFTVANGSPADRIAKWNGLTWSALGTGLNGGNGSVAVQAGGDIWVGGGFTTAGCNLSPYLARWRETVWTGSTNTDWHTTANWGSGSIPSANAGITILSTDSSITSGDVTVSSLIVSGDRTLTVGAGRTLTVTGNLDLSNGSLAGSGALVVNGDLSLNNGNISGLASITIGGNLYLSGGMISGPGTVFLTACRAGSLVGGTASSFISAPLTRCVTSTGVYRFPVGTAPDYSPIVLSNVVGTGSFTVDPRSGAYSGPATGLPTNRLQRWWQLTNGGIAQADLTFNYSDSEVVGLEEAYRVFRINGGAAEVVPATFNMTANTASVTGVTSFSAWTMAEAPEANVTVGGRVTRSGGIGIPFITVTLSDGLGNTRTIVTKFTGHYEFQNVAGPRSYTLTVAPRKRTAFAVPQRVVVVSENLSNVNFVSSTP